MVLEAVEQRIDQGLALTSFTTSPRCRFISLPISPGTDTSLSLQGEHKVGGAL
jgi:hypothetical protein